MRNFLRQVKGLMTSRPAGMDDLFAQTNWAVVGSHGRNPIASQLVEKLKSNNKNTYTVNPSLGKQSDNNKSAQLPSAQYKSLSDVLEDGKKVDVVNLVINPVKGIGKITIIRLAFNKHIRSCEGNGESKY